MRNNQIRFWATDDEAQALTDLAAKMHEKNLPETFRTLIRKALTDNKVPTTSDLFAPVDFNWLRRKVK